jgi:hypothetical protein
MMNEKLIVKMKLIGESNADRFVIEYFSSLDR